MHAGKEVEGFIVHAFTRTHHGSTQLCLIGRLATGQSFALVDSRERPHLFVREGDEGQLTDLIVSSGLADSVEVTPTRMRTMDGEPCRFVSASTQSELSKLVASLDGRLIRSYEADIKLADSFLIDRSVRGSIRINGDSRPGRYVDLVFLNPEISPSSWAPALSVTSIDIETNPFGQEIYAIAFQALSYSGASSEGVYLRARPSGARASPWNTDVERLAAEEGWALKVFATEEELLRAWMATMVELDPDIITGWNVTSFDFSRIVSRLDHFRIPFRIGRSGDAGTFFEAAAGKPSAVVVPGRQVLDALRIARSGPRRFADHSLETVASEVLGRGKAIVARSTREKLEQIEEMYSSNPLALCRYCLEDARLVNEILEVTGLLDLTLKRSLLIGVPLSRAWTSIAAFDFVYIEAMHRRGIVAPTVGVDVLPMASAPGGAIISPYSGLFDNVLVFDFKSLYPSIIRTFNIDPLAFRGGTAVGGIDPHSPRGPRDASSVDVVEAPNGARFHRGAAILPALLDDLFAAREEAKRRGDSTASYVYKILSNSFYGVLGASGCRFAGSDLAGAITAFGKKILYWCRDLLEGEGYHTLYGDTDSLFVKSNLPRATDDGVLRGLGQRLCALVNERLRDHIRDRYRLDSKLELEFEKVYVRFFIPPLRGSSSGRTGGAQRGRAKGYAGYLHAYPEASPASTAGGNVDAGAASETPEACDERTTIEVKGMEAVRRDWTEAAKELQLTLLRMVFEDAPLPEISSFLRRYTADMRNGLIDDKLVYSKALRKPVSQYTNALPPHVQAARHLDKLDQNGVVSYLWTTAGPQPVGATTAPIDYDHYEEKQLKPIVGTFEEVLHADLASSFETDGQLDLF